jgi:hypothetical protein
VAVSRPLASSIVAAGLTFALRLFYGHWLPLLPRLALESIILLVTFLGTLVFVTGQKSLYLDLLRGLKREQPGLPSET